MAGKITPNLQQAQDATLDAARAVRTQLTDDQFRAMTDGTVTVFDVFVAQKLVKSFTADGAPDPDDPGAQLWQALEQQKGEQDWGATAKETLNDGLMEAAASVSRLMDAADEKSGVDWSVLFSNKK